MKLVIYTDVDMLMLDIFTTNRILARSFKIMKTPICSPLLTEHFKYVIIPTGSCAVKLDKD